MKKAFAHVKTGNRVVEVEAIAIVVRKGGRMIALYHSQGCGFHPLSLAGMMRDDDGEMEIIYRSPNYDKLSQSDFRDNYIWKLIQDGNYRIEQPNNLEAVSAMKGELLI